MTSGSLPDAVQARLSGVGLALIQADTGGPMGSANWRYSDGVVDIEVYNDRGRMGASAGRAGGDTFQHVVWARVFGSPASTTATLDEQLDFFLQHLQQIRDAVTHDPAIDT